MMAAIKNIFVDTAVHPGQQLEPSSAYTLNQTGDPAAANANHTVDCLCSQAQYNYPYPSTGVNDSIIPAYPVRAACQLLADPKLEGTPLFTAMSQTVSVFEGNASTTCIDTTGAGQLNNRPFTYQVSILPDAATSLC